MQRRNLRADVVYHQVRYAHILSDDTVDIFVFLSLAVQHAGWDLQPLFKDFAIVDT